MPSGQHRTFRLTRLAVVLAMAAAAIVALVAPAAVARPAHGVKVDTDNVCGSPIREDNLISSGEEIFVWLNSPTGLNEPYTYTIYNKGQEVVSGDLDFEACGGQWYWAVAEDRPDFTGSFTLTVYDGDDNIVASDSFLFFVTDGA
jgi:hypothetical protein